MLPRRVAERLHSEDGFALITVMAVMAITLGFASAAAIAAMNALGGTVRDEDSKMALGAADAGASAALGRQNTIAGEGANICLTPGAGGVLTTTSTQSDGWCPPVSGSVDGATYSYQTYPASDGSLRIVSVGSSDQVNRRIELTATNSSGFNPFAEAGFVGKDWIHLDSNAKIFANAATNGSITKNSNAKLCGSASVGIGQSVVPSSGSSHSGGSSCSQSTYPVVQQPLDLPPVQQGDVTTNNSNGRFFSQDLVGGKKKDVSWNPSTRELTVNGNSSLTLGGSNYSLCSLRLRSNSDLYIAAGSSVRIFFDAPENCPGVTTTQFDMDSNSTIETTSGLATDFALLFVGSDTISTQITLNSNGKANTSCGLEFLIYAPKTDIDADSNAKVCGGIAGKTLHADSNFKFYSQSETNDFELPGAHSHYTVDRFVECTVAATASAAGC